MEYVNLGRSGLKVSRIGVGGFSFGSPSWQPWVLDEEHSRPILRRAVELGVNYFDTADMYSDGASEEVIGRAIRDFARREEVVLATKFYHPTGRSVNERGLSRKHVMDAIDLSLRRFGVDYVDLYQFHRLQHATPIEETLAAMDDLIRSGKVRYAGASNMLAWQLARALYTQDRRGWTRLISIQNHYNLAYREEEREMLPLCREEGVGVTPFSPLARGFLSRGPDDRSARAGGDPFIDRFYGRDSDREIRDRAIVLARRRGAAPAQIALAWLLRQPAVTAPIVGATRPRHVEQAVAALDIALDDDELRILEEPYEPHPLMLHVEQLW